MKLGLAQHTGPSTAAPGLWAGLQQGLAQHIGPSTARLVTCTEVASQRHAEGCPLAPPGRYLLYGQLREDGLYCTGVTRVCLALLCASPSRGRHGRAHPPWGQLPP
eukprot:365087-Chlamydomonas_euryale.AAC.18